MRSHLRSKGGRNHPLVCVVDMGTDHFWAPQWGTWISGGVEKDVFGEIYQVREVELDFRKTLGLI